MRRWAFIPGEDNILFQSRQGKLAMRRFSRSLWLAALCAVLCPAAVRAQATNSTAYYQSEDDESQVVSASAMTGCGPCQGCACGSCCDNSCCNDCCGCGGL